MCVTSAQWFCEMERLTCLCLNSIRASPPADTHLLLSAVGLNTDAEESRGLSLQDPQEEIYIYINTWIIKWLESYICKKKTCLHKYTGRVVCLLLWTIPQKYGMHVYLFFTSIVFVLLIISPPSHLIQTRNSSASFSLHPNSGVIGDFQHLELVIIPLMSSLLCKQCQPLCKVQGLEGKDLT